MARKKLRTPELVLGKLLAKLRTARGRKPAGQKHAFYQLGDAYEAADNWTVIVATQALFFTITQEMIDRAKTRSPKFCVVGQALAVLFGNMYSFQVGSGETKIWDFEAKIEVRFKTPSVLSRAISSFDRKKGWNLPPNLYKLAPMYRKVIDKRKNYVKSKKKVLAKKTVSPVRRKARKQSTVVRTVLRNTRVSWSKLAA